jgi:autotransporter translocation and assembly factor TamB
VRDLRVVYPQPALQPLYGGKLRLDLAPDAARLAVDAKSMGGSVRARAEAKGIEDPESLDLTANARLKDFPVKAGQLARVDLEADVEGTIRREEGTRVDVRLHDGFVTLPDETTRDLHPITSPGEVTYVSELEVTRPEEDEEKEPEGPPVIIHIDVEDPISIRGDPVTARLDLDLESRTNVEKNAGLQGEIWVTDGTVDLVGREYKIEKAEIILEGRQPPNPRIDVRLVHFFSASGVEFMVRVSGNANEPRVDFASSPARFSETELLSIFTGTDPSDIGQVDDRPPEEQAAGAAVGFITGQIQQQLGQVLPLDTLEVGASETGVSNVTLGKWITREVFLAYRQEFRAQENQNPFEAVLEYRFLPGWLAELVVGPLAQDLDVLWTTRW